MNILIIDDHPMIVSFYETALKEYFNNAVTIINTNNCESAYNEITTTKSDYTIAIIDISLPPYIEKNILSGADIVSLIRKKNAVCKIILITGHEKKLLLYDIFKQTRPDAIVTKSNVTAENFIEIINEVLAGNQFVGSFVRKAISDIWSNSILADELNREILINLEKGYKINELHAIIPLAEITIRKRIASIRKAMQISKDDNLIAEIKKREIL